MGNEVFLTELIQLGIEGLDLKTVIDRIPNSRLARMTNVVRTELGSIRLRPGQALIGQAIGATVSSTPGVGSGGIPFVIRETLKGLQFGFPGSIGLDTTLASDLRDLGVSIVRVDVTTEAFFDSFVDLFGDRGISTLGLMNHALIPFNSSNDWETEAYRQEFTTRARQIVQRYSAPTRPHKVNFWQIWNEPDLDLSGTGGPNTRIEPDNYGKLLITVYPVIKAVDPTATIILGGISPKGSQFSQNYLRDLYQSPAITAYRNATGDHPWDALALHPYAETFITPPGLISVVNNFKATMNSFGDRLKKVWLTELGWRTTQVSEAQQATFCDQVYRLLDVLVDPGFPGDPPYIERAIWYRYHDEAAPGLYGLRTQDLSRKKPAYDAYLNLGSPEVIVPPPPPPPPVVIDPNADVHSILRLNSGPNSFSRILGIGPALFHGISGTFAASTTGFSGDPLHLVPYRPPLSSESWAYIGDRTKNGKIRADGKFLPIGLDPPPTAPRIARDTEQVISIEQFDVDPGWTNNVGSSNNTPTHAIIEGREGSAIQFSTAKPSSGTGGYYQFWGINAGPIDLSRFPNGSPATDDDVVHLFIHADRPDLIDEVRIYLGLGPFNNSQLPGVGDENKNAYVKAFRPGDFVNFIAALESAAAASGRAARTIQSEGSFPPPVLREDNLVAILPLFFLGKTGLMLSLFLLLTLFVLGVIRTDDQERIRENEERRGVPLEITHGRNQWSEFGVIGIPLRRGDFLRIGDDKNLNWSSITGITVYVSVLDVGDNVLVSVDNLYLRGGAKLETIEPGLPNYDYRSINVDPSTGEKSNPSPIMELAGALDSIRQAINVTPATSPRAGAIQWIYRRGGTLVDNWYFVGKNSSNGGVFRDTISDQEALAAGVLEIDNDRPVTTISAAGVTVRAQPVAAIFGPISDMLLAVGDPLRPGHVYWCKPGEPDSWPPQNNIEVCPPSEQLLTGFIHGSEAFAFSRERLYRLYPSLTGETGQVNYVPTQCKKGPQERWMVVESSYGIFFIADDGIYRTDGGPAQSISDATIEELFKGRARNGYDAISTTDRQKLRLEIFNNKLWFQYSTTANDVRILVYDLIFNFWSAFHFGHQTASLYAEGPSPQSTLLLGGRGTGKVYVLGGTIDEDVPITANIRTGALDQGAPRREKVYGDLSLDLSGDPAAELGLEVLADDEAVDLDAATINPTLAKDRQLFDVFKSARRRNLSLDLTWTDPTVNLYYAGIQYLIDEAVQRIRWESEETDHGIQAQQTPLYGMVAIRSTAPVTLAMTTYRADGTNLVKTYTIPATAEIKRQVFVPFEATKGVVFRYRFTSTEPFQIYKEESFVIVRAWDGQENKVQPFGDSLAVSPAEIRAVRGQE